MTQQAWKPKISEGGGFDRLAWRRAVRASGVLRELKRSDWAVLWHAYDHADGLGQVDLPREHVGEEKGLNPKDVARAAGRLVGLGLLAEIPSRRGSKVKRYQLTDPPAAAPTADEGGPIKLPTRTWASPSDPPTRTPTSGSTGHPRPVDPDTHVPQSRIESRQDSSSRRCVPTTGPGLFEARGFDRAAAAILISCKLNQRTAAALAARYRLTRVEARNVRANLRAARRAKVPVHNPVGWVRAMVAEGHVSIEHRVQAELDRRRADRRRRRQQQAARQAEAQQQQHAADQARAREACAARYDAMTDTDRQALHAEVLAEPLLSGVEVAAWRLREWSIDLLAEQHNPKGNHP